MCTDTTSQHDEMMCSWSIDDTLVILGSECVLDRIFDTASAYNICVTAFNSGEFLYCQLFLVSCVISVCCGSCKSTAEEAVILAGVL